jgi:hypothetical protein
MRRPIPAPWKVGFLILFLAIAGIIAFVTYDRVYTFILSFNLAQLPGVAILDTPTPGSMVDGTPASSPIPTQASGPPPDPWVVVAASPS